MPDPHMTDAMNKQAAAERGKTIATMLKYANGWVGSALQLYSYKRNGYHRLQ